MLLHIGDNSQLIQAVIICAKGQKLILQYIPQSDVCTLMQSGLEISTHLLANLALPFKLQATCKFCLAVKKYRGIHFLEV